MKLCPHCGNEMGKVAVLEPPKWVQQYDVWGEVVSSMEEKYGKGKVPYQAAVAYYKNKCRKMGLDAEGMEESNGYKGLRPLVHSPERRLPTKLSQQLTWPCILKHDRVRCPDMRGREIGTVEKVYMDGSLDVDFPSDKGNITFIDSSKDSSVQKVGLSVGDKIDQGDGSTLTVKSIHVNKEAGVYAATISHNDGKEEVVLLTDVERV